VNTGMQIHSQLIEAVLIMFCFNQSLLQFVNIPKQHRLTGA